MTSEKVCNTLLQLQYLSFFILKCTRMYQAVIDIILVNNLHAFVFQNISKVLLCSLAQLLALFENFQI